jgi:hypothetical protein
LTASRPERQDHKTTPLNPFFCILSRFSDTEKMASPTQSTGSSKVDAIVQQAAVTKPQLSGAALYSRFALAGAVCCSVTHGALTPVDVYVATRPARS